MKHKAALAIGAMCAIVFVMFYSMWLVRAVATTASSDVQPAFVNVGQVINFTVYNWDEPSDQELYICKQATCASCDSLICNPSYCWGRVLTPSASPARLRYTTLSTDDTGSQTWYYKLRNTSGDYSNCRLGTGTFEINHAPSISVSITPSSPTPVQNLVCNGDVTDVDSSDSPFTVACAWAGCSVGCPACSASCSLTSCTATLSQTYTRTGDSIYCNMTPSDEHSFAGSTVQSASVTVGYNASMAISPDTATIEKGSTQTFSVNIGIAPFNWTVHTGTACRLSASTTSSVVLTGISAGNCTINVTDSRGMFDLSGVIRIVDTDAPTGITNLAASDVPGDQGSRILVSWALSADDGAGDNDVDRYEIMRSEMASSGYANIANVSARTTTHYDNTAVDGTTYYYTVRACDTTDLCTNSAYNSAVANAQPIMKSVNITNSIIRYGTTVECVGSAYDVDNEPLSMSYSFTIMAFPPGGYSHTVEGNASCIFFGANITDQYGVYHQNATSECRAVLNASHITKADKLVCSMISSDGRENSSSMRITQPYRAVNNTPPFATGVVIYPSTPNASSVLTCNYIFNDIDGDAEDVGSATFHWYINNEGLNQYIEVPSQESKVFSGPFDKDDYVICAVRVKDLDSSWMAHSNYALDYANSSGVKVINNALPQVVDYFDNSNETMPTNVGADIIFRVNWIDYENPTDTASLYVCDDYSKEENQYNGANKSVQFGDDDKNSPKYVWFYTNKTGQYAQNIAVKPFKYLENNRWTYAANTVVESGDAFVGSTLRNFSLEAYYDADGSGTYTYGEPIIREQAASGTRLKFDQSIDQVLVGQAPIQGSLLSNFSRNRERYVDRDSSGNFTVVDDVYWDRDGDYAVTIGDYRRTVVTQSDVRKTNTNFKYDILVYEVQAIGDTDQNSSSILIARDNDNALVMGRYNYFVPQYNAKPRSNRYLAFKFCIDSDNNDICDSDADFMNDSVFVHASNATDTVYKVITSDGKMYYRPDIKINYREYSTGGCSQTQYCNTSLSSSSPLSCSYRTQDSDKWENNYLVKVCDQSNGCSIARPGVFFVNHLPTVANVNITSSKQNYTDTANLNCTAYGMYDPDGNNISLRYAWYLKRAGTYTKYNIPSNQILTNGNTLVGDEWKCEVLPSDPFAQGVSRNSSSVRITNATYSNLLPTILSVRDDSNSSYPTNVGSRVTFRISWSDAGSSQVKAYICNSSSILDNGCWDLTFNSTSFSSANPVVGTYTARQGDSEKNYWVRICDTTWNCSNNYPNGNQRLNFTVNHRPNASNISVIIDRTLTATVLTCNHTYNDMDSDNESGSQYKWYISDGSGFAEVPSLTTINITSGFSEGDVVRCSVRVRDVHGFSDVRYRNSSNQLAITRAPRAPILSSLPSAVRQNTIFVVGFINETGINVTAYAKQGFLTPTVGHQVTTENSTMFGAASVLYNFSKGRKYVVVSELKSTLFTTSRFVEFGNHYRANFIRYSITGKSDLLDGTYRIDLGQNLSEKVPLGTSAKVYNSSRPSGWFNISLSLFNDSNVVRVRGKTAISQGPFVETSVFVDLYPPSINIQAVPSITNTLFPLLRFNLSDNYQLNDSTLLVTIRNNSHIWNYSTRNTLYSRALKNISCAGNQTFKVCSLPTSLRNGSYNLTFMINDSADYNVTARKVLTIDTSAIIVTNVTDGYIDQDGKHMPSDYSTTTHLIANWTRMTGIDHYEYKLVEYDGAVFRRTLVNWTSVGLSRTVNSTYNMTNGYVYHFVIRARVSAGGYTSETSSDGILYLDSTAPTCVNCVHDQGDYANSNSTLHGYWNFTEPESRLVEYRYALGTSCYPYVGYNNVVPVTTRYTNQVSVMNLHLLDGVKYCFSVKAKNENNLWSYWFTSDNITVDLSKPYNGTISYPSGYVRSTVVQVNFSQGYDDVSGINRTQLYMGSVPLSNGQCNGLFDYNPVGTQVLGQTHDTISVQTGNCYRFQYKVFDKAGNIMAYPQGVATVVRIDTTPPTQFTATLNNNQFYTYSTTLNIAWTQSSDPQSGISRYRYALFDGSTQLTNYINTSLTSGSIIYALEHQHTYYITVIAYNSANGSTSALSNNILFIDVTPPSMVRLLRVENDTNASNGYLDTDGNNRTTIRVAGELGMECIVSPYDIDFTSDTGLPYVTSCSLIGSGPNATCSLNLTDGNYTYYVVCRDSNGNAQSSAQNLAVNWIVDRYGPNITINSPRQNEVVGGQVTLDASIRDLGVGVSEAFYRVEDLSQNLYASGSLFAPAWDALWDTRGRNYSGVYVLIVKANDTLGRRSNSSVSFFINNGVPALALQNPSYAKGNFTITLIPQMFVNATFNVTNSSRYLFSRSVNSSQQMRNYLVWQKRINTSSPTQWKDGNYTINAWAVNNRSNRTVRKSWVIFDRTAPRYSHVTNTSGRTYYKDSVVKLNVSWSDNFRLSQVKFSHNASGNWTNASAITLGNYSVYTIQPSLLRNHQSIGWFAFATDMAGNINYSMPVQGILISNRAPVLNPISNKTVNASELVSLVATASDQDGDNLTYFINDSRFTKSSSTFRWNTTVNDSGVYAVNVTVSDGFLNDSQRVRITVLFVYDTDHDGIPDYKDNDSDNDGLANSVDFLNGFSYSINTTVPHFNCSVGGSFDLGQKFNDSRLVNCTNSSTPIVSFAYNFSQGITLHMIRITVMKGRNGTRGWTLVKGLSLPGDSRKTVYLDDLNQTVNSVCVKDTEVASVSQISSTCNLADEHLVVCDRSLYYGNFTCTDLGSYYMVTGLRHSAVREQTGCTDRDGDGYGVGCSAGTDYDDNNPQIHSAPSRGGGSSSGGGGGGGSLPQCNNRIDDDRDGLVDMADPGCLGRLDNDESNPCIESWVCTPWTECSARGKQTRQCIDAKMCGTAYSRPIEVQSCQAPATGAVVETAPSCWDGIRNQGEANTDCGGLCQTCPTCVDGIQDQEETGVDCGGPCPPCSQPESQQPEVPVRTTILSTFSTIAIGLIALLVIIIIVLVFPRPKAKPLQEPIQDRLQGAEIPSYSEYVRTQHLFKVEKIVLAQLYRGRSRAEIEAALATKGWPTDIIDRMIKLDNFVRLELSKGIPQAAIRASLQRAGWHPEIIDEVFSNRQGPASKF